MKIGDRERSTTCTTRDLDLGVECCEGDEWIGGLHRDTRIGPAEDRMSIVQAFPRAAAASGNALVAAPGQRRFRAEIGTASLLQDVAADRRAVPDLRGCRLQARVGQHRGVLAHDGVLADLIERCESTDGQAVIELLDGIQARDAGDVDHRVGCGDAESEPVEQLGAAGDRHGARPVDRKNVIETLRHVVVEIAHGLNPSSSLPHRAPRQ